MRRKYWEKNIYQNLEIDIFKNENMILITIIRYYIPKFFMYVLIKNKALEIFGKKNKKFWVLETFNAFLISNSWKKKYEIKNNVIYENIIILIFCIYIISFKKKISIIYHILYFTVSSTHFKPKLYNISKILLNNELSKWYQSIVNMRIYNLT